MAGSQLKRLKASLREQGITGPQQSKKQKRRVAQDEKARNEKRLKRGVVLDGIREQFNPFDLKHAAKPKFEVTSLRSATHPSKAILGRPGESKAASEEMRRQTLLVEMQRRNKVGGILDKRFGEDDPTMTPEDRMLERFAKEKQRSHKNSSMFDLEEDDEPMEGLTHGGKSLTFEDEELVDDFQEDDLEAEYDSDGSVRERQRLKRMHAMTHGDASDDHEQPDRKKSKKEVMDELIAKSKLHRYERQAAKEEDADLRVELDKELPAIQMLLASSRKGGKAREEVDNGLTIGGVDRDTFDRNFDLEVKKLARDKRAQPAERTKTEEEIAEEKSQQLKEQEEKRQRRMRGEEVTDSEDDDPRAKKDTEVVDNELGEEEEDDFGLGRGIRARPTATDLGFDDEDDFIIDDDLVASGTDMGSDLEFESGDEMEDMEAEDNAGAEDEDEFTKGLLNEEEARNPAFNADAATKASAAQKSDDKGLPFTFPCPETCEEFQAITTKYDHHHTPTVVQRIRALYHPKLDSKNKERLALFSVALVDFIASPWDPETSPPFSVLENVVRHIHSLAKTFPLEIAKQFRSHLEEMSQERPLSLQAADLVVLTAIGTIFPTSDHFHQVVTPAMLTMGRCLSQKIPRGLHDYSTGAFLSILSLQYQQLSKRYVPEVLNFSLNTLCALAPVAPSSGGSFPRHAPPRGCRIEDLKKVETRRLSFHDCLPGVGEDKKRSKETKIAILNTAISILDAAADLWSGKESFTEIFSQPLAPLRHLSSEACKTHLPKAILERAERLHAKLERMLGIARLSRRPLELHHHRPLAIKMYIPKFEETFDPEKHYDPNRERAELAKLKAEHKKERKGAMRELRKDANFMAREKLRVKKAKDEAYEKKYKRIVAEIQSEEGREANEYEREKSARKRARNR
ncbi:nucleolar protein 14 [Stachybotrys elegans]|uniref:Nucleolar protein 14 n=1 Tax=Stachybotrys elegans TaxID=80388 RepID=A0A8K0T341_9HYPO|nr:nucleolar protein 14 [Stachybotrys elegans]